MIIERILSFIDYKGLSKNKFYKETGLSNGFLDKVKDIGASKVEYILNTYPDLSAEWLILGKGEMIKSADFSKTKSTDNLTLSKGKKKGKEKEHKRNVENSLPFTDYEKSNLSVEDIIANKVLMKIYPLLISSNDKVLRKIEDIECFMEAIRLKIKIESEIENIESSSKKEIHKES